MAAKRFLKRLLPGGKTEDEEEEFEEPSPEEIDDAEKQMAERQAVEYENQPWRPQSDEENVAKLFEVESKLSITKSLQRVKDPKSGIESDIGIESADDYPEPFNTDIPKADMKDSEIKACWGNVTLINMLRIMGKSNSFPLQSIAQFNNAQKDSIVNLSRGRGGFTAILSRTHKSVSEGVVEHLKKQQKEQKEKKWGLF